MKKPPSRFYYWLPGGAYVFSTEGKYHNAREVREMVRSVWFPNRRRLPDGVEVYRRPN